MRGTGQSVRLQILLQLSTVAGRVGDKRGTLVCGGLPQTSLPHLLPSLPSHHTHTHTHTHTHIHTLPGPVLSYAPPSPPSPSSLLPPRPFPPSLPPPRPYHSQLLPRVVCCADEDLHLGFGLREEVTPEGGGGGREVRMGGREGWGICAGREGHIETSHSRPHNHTRTPAQALCARPSLPPHPHATSSGLSIVRS